MTTATRSRLATLVYRRDELLADLAQLRHKNTMPSGEERTEKIERLRSDLAEVRGQIELAGWSYAAPTVCDDPIQRGVSYPWHEGTGAYCDRCGAKDPR